MRKATGLVIASCLASSGCLTGFQHPLGPAGEGLIEPQLIGRWACVSSDPDTEGPSAGSLTFLDFDGKQYYIQSRFENEEVVHARAYSTRVDEVTFINVRTIGPKPEDEWTFLQYALVNDHLALRYVDPQPFEDVIDDAASVRDRLAGLLQDPEVVGDFLSCTRNETGK